MVMNCQWVLGIRCGFSAKANNAFNCRVSFPALSFHLLMPSSKADPASCISNVANSRHSSAGALFSGQSDYTLRSILVPHLNGGAFRVAGLTGEHMGSNPAALCQEGTLPTWVLIGLWSIEAPGHSRCWGCSHAPCQPERGSGPGGTFVRPNSRPLPAPARPSCHSGLSLSP